MIQKKYKILTVVGARPQFIKAAPLSKAIAQSDNLTEILVHTGQHYDYSLSQQFFNELGLPTPQYNLEIGSGRHAYQMGQILIKLDAVLEKENPDMVVVFGDTNSTAAAAITAAKNNIPLAHVEAGLREWNKQIPEEINKLLTDSVTDLYFCPTKTGVKNLEKQGITEGVYLVGDIGIDLIANNLDKIEKHKTVLEALEIQAKNYFFVTIHRAANTLDSNKLQQILLALKSIADDGFDIVFPIHPRTQAAIEQFNLSSTITHPRIKILEPVGFWDTQVLIRNAKMTITDSGGVVKEAYFHRVPCIIPDTQIEWLEAIEEGWTYLTEADTSKILARVQDFPPPSPKESSRIVSNSFKSGFLGNGTAARQIVDIIFSFLENRH